MTPQVLLDAFRSLLAAQPPLEGQGRYGPEQHQWLGRAIALVTAWDAARVADFRFTAQAMAGNLNRYLNFGAIQTTLHEAVASIEANLPSQQGQVFGPGAVYDFFRALNDLISSAERSLFVIDPYMDGEVFDGYLSNAKPAVSSRLLVSRSADAVKVAAEKFRAQRGSALEVKRSTEIHDRVVFVDGARYWVLGASIKDAAAKKPTYLAPLPDDVIPEKLRIYDALWAAAVAI